MTLDFELPPLDATTRPAFDTAAKARQWAQEQALANPVQVQTELQHQLDLLNRTALPVTERIGIHDALRPLLDLVQEESAKRWSGKPLPLLHGEQNAFETARALRSTFISGALRGVADSTDSKQKATALQRALVALGGQAFELLRGRQQPGPDFWRRLHQLMFLAESSGVATLAVTDPARYGSEPTTATAAWAETVLLHASSPFELPLRHFLWMARWARRWAGRMTLGTAPSKDPGAVPLYVDLTSDLSPRHTPFAGEGARFLLTNDVRVTIKKRVALLGEGRTPAELQLGDDCVQPACENLLKSLYQRWCKGGAQRGSERQGNDASGRVIFGVEDIHYHLSGGKRLQQPAQHTIADLRREREEMATFGKVQTERTEIDDRPAPPIEDQWLIRDESATGLRLSRPVSAIGARVALGQLAAVEPPGAKHFFLGAVRWVMRDHSDRLQIGAHLMPGPALALPVRVQGEPWRHGFMLPPLAARSEPACVVVPTGTFRTDRVIEIRGGGIVKQIVLRRLLERGTDYERASYESA